ncbi:MAG TPA: hypothetical protein V6C95_12225, partial [Coleofasciculaceae cyanobacterium]
SLGTRHASPVPYTGLVRSSKSALTLGISRLERYFTHPIIGSFTIPGLRGSLPNWGNTNERIRVFIRHLKIGGFQLRQ